MRDMIAELEAKIRANRVGEVHEAINAIAFADVPRLHAAKMANLALRSGALFWAIRLLNPIVRSNSAGVKATAEELAEYGFALNRIGAHLEAERVLREIEHHPIPRIQIYLAAIHANAWDYVAAKACFEKYLGFSELTPYERRIGKLNLAGSLIGAETDFEGAGAILGELREELAREGNKLLHGNALELSAQLALKRGDHGECARWIEEGRKIFPGIDSIFSLFFKKWENVSLVRRGAGDPVRLMGEVRDEAIRLQHHETIREADFHLFAATGDRALFDKLYFGTPWPRYRERLVELAPGYVVSSHYDHAPLGTGGSILDVDAFGARAGGHELKAGQLLHRALVALTRDLYRPSWVAAAFNALFPDEFYHPESGPKRVHQAVFRLRNWFVEAGVPIEIEEKNGRYFLDFKQPCSIRLVPAELPAAEIAEEASLRKVAAAFGESAFGSKDVARALDVSSTTARDFLKWAVESGRLEKISSGPKTRYKRIS